MPTFSSESDRTNENNADSSNAFAQIGRKYRTAGQTVIKNETTDTNIVLKATNETATEHGKNKARIRSFPMKITKPKGRRSYGRVAKG